MVNNMKDDASFEKNHLESHPMFSSLILTWFSIDIISIIISIWKNIGEFFSLAKNEKKKICIYAPGRDY